MVVRVQMGGVSGRSVQSSDSPNFAFRCRRGVKLLALYLGSWVRSMASTAFRVNIQHVINLYDIIC